MRSLYDKGGIQTRGRPVAHSQATHTIQVPSSNPSSSPPSQAYRPLMLVSSDIGEVFADRRQYVYLWPSWAIKSTVDVKVIVPDPGSDEESPNVAEIPPEILNIIIGWIREGIGRYSITGPDYPSIRKPWKQEIGRLTLTCRKWMEMFRRSLFFCPWIYGPEDLWWLRAHPSVMKYIYYLNIVYHGTPTPWIHRINSPVDSPIEQWKRAGKAVNLLLDIDVEQYLAHNSTKNFPFRSLFRISPKSLPTPHIKFSKLAFFNCTFARFVDLVHLFGELPTIERADMINVNWPSPDELPRFPVRPRRIKLDVTACDGCSEPQDVLLLHQLLGCFTAEASPNTIYICILDDSEAMYLQEYTRKFMEFSQTLWRSREGELMRVLKQWKVTLSHDSMELKNREKPWLAKSRFVPGAIHGQTSLNLTYGMPQLSYLSEPGASDEKLKSPLTTHIVKIHFHFEFPNIPLEPQYWNLQELDRFADSFSFLQRFEVTLPSLFWYPDRVPEYHRITAEVKKQMPVMRQSGRLRIVDGEGWVLFES